MHLFDKSISENGSANNLSRLMHKPSENNFYGPSGNVLKNLNFNEQSSINQQQVQQQILFQ